MRIKDYKRFIISTQRLINKAASAGIIDLTAAVVDVDFQNNDPQLLVDRITFYSKQLKTVAFYALQSNNTEIASRATKLYEGVRKGGVKRV